MRRTVALMFLGAMAVGLLFTAFGTQYSNEYAPQVAYCHLFCEVVSGISPIATHFNFELNYLGGFLAIIGATAFAILYPFSPMRH